MPRFSRRRFIERLGLGAGAALLTPIADTLVSRALGQPRIRPRIVLFVAGGGIGALFSGDRGIIPPGVDPGDRGGGDRSWSPILDGPTDFPWPSMFEALAPFRSQAVIVDGLDGGHDSQPDRQHGVGYAALTSVTGRRDAPSGISIDQVWAGGALGQGVPHASVLLGVSHGDADERATVFASGRDQPLRHTESPGLFVERLFGAGVATAMRDDGRRRRAVLDTIRQDVGALEAALAPEERRGLERYYPALRGLRRAPGRGGEHRLQRAGGRPRR